MWRSWIAVICHCRYFCAQRGGHGSPLFVIAVAVVAGVDVVVVVVLLVFFTQLIDAVKNHTRLIFEMI